MSDFPSSWSTLDVCLCHDWLTGMRGGERVLEILADGFPEAGIDTLLYRPDGVSERLTRHPVHPSWLNRLPGIHRHYRWLLPLFPGAMDRFPAFEGDLLISTSHCVAKNHRTGPNTKHLCYCFTPMRYAWRFEEEYFGGNPLKKAIIGPMLARLRDIDRRQADRVDRFVAISHAVKDRIKEYYDRDADVVYPPVNATYFTPDETAERGDEDLILSALVPYKKVDLAVQAYTRSGRKLAVIGSGTEYDALRRMAGPTVRFLGRLPDDEIRTAYRRARLLIFPGEEDFGIVPLEAMACGTPVVAFGTGGATETVADGISGVFFQKQTVEALLEAVDRASAITWDRQAVRARAEEFDIPVFITALDAAMQRTLSND